MAYGEICWLMLKHGGMRIRIGCACSIASDHVVLEFLYHEVKVVIGSKVDSGLICWLRS